MFSEFAMQGIVEARFYFGGKVDGLFVAEKLDGHFGLVDDHGAFFAAGEMQFQFVLDGRIEFTVDVIGKFADYGVAVQLGALRRK